MVGWIQYNITTDAQLIIYNKVGEIIRFEIVSKDSQSLVVDLSNYKNGIYTCRLVQDGKVDVEQYQSLAQKFNVRSIPTLILFKDGKEVEIGRAHV